MHDKIEEQIFVFVGWIYQNYGRLGCAVCLFIILAVLTGVYFLLNTLPEPKTTNDIHTK